jgi:hypothetical protein
MEWYRASCRIDDPHPEFFDGVDQMRSQRHYPAGSFGWLGKSYPTPSDMHVWLRFAPSLPVHLRTFVEICGFSPVLAPDEVYLAISWSDLFTTPMAASGALSMVPITVGIPVLGGA